MKYENEIRNEVPIGERGFSLVELLIVTVVLTVVIGIISATISATQQIYASERRRMEAINDAGATLDTITRLIRIAGNNTNLVPILADPNNDGVFNDIRIRSDWHPADGDLNDTYEDISFRTVNGVLQKQEPSIDGGQWVPFMENIQSVTFTYFNSAGALLATPQTNHDQIVSVQIVLVTNGPNPMTYTSHAAIRERR